MLDFKSMQIKALSPLIALGLILLVLVGVVKAVIGTLLTLAFPNLFGSIDLTETLLFLIFVMLVRLYMLAASRS